MTPPNDRIEVVLMADQARPMHLWLQSTAELARRYSFNKEKSVRVVGGAAALLFVMFLLSPGGTVILLLLSLIVFFPMSLVGMAGFFRGGV
ncbi:hypothetical protein [Methylocystis echinoides]|uniref:Transmembrane protein n=1 Tax=Methylocystis echinoides TaxID=29468 RepID=A0A9W6GXP6_9HYPH|nr:hypothetical protein [Methylocystis echinoides]GLI94993.1 hypothetical protein LMG27198_39850 [Methylocystis echinoides]